MSGLISAGALGTVALKGVVHGAAAALGAKAVSEGIKAVEESSSKKSSAKPATA
jgi:hypothetical protein